MFAKKNRLTKKRDIDKVYKGRSAKGSFFVIRYIEGRKDNPRITIIAGKKVSAKSTERNLVKRRISESVRQKIDNMETLDTVINVFPQALSASYEQINKEVERLFMTAGILKNKK